MKKSKDDRAIIAERLRDARELLLSIGSNRLGPPGLETRAAIEQVDDLALLGELAVQALSAADWRELVARA